MSRAPGGEAGEGRAGGGGANASRPPCPRPPGALRRPDPAARGDDGGRRAPSAVGYGSPQPGLPAPESPRCQSARAASSCSAHAPPVSPGASRSGVLRNGGHRLAGARRARVTPSSGLLKPAVYQNASQRAWELGERCAAGRYRLGADGTRTAAGTRASCLPTVESREAASIEDFPHSCLRLVVTCTSVVIPVKLLFHGR